MPGMCPGCPRGVPGVSLRCTRDVSGMRLGCFLGMGRNPSCLGKKAGNGISWTLWSYTRQEGMGRNPGNGMGAGTFQCHTRQEAPGNSLPGRLKSLRVSASGLFPLRFPGHGKSACWETRWISGIYCGPEPGSPGSSRRELGPCHPWLLQVVPCPPRQFLGRTQLNLSHLSFPSRSCSPAEGKPFPAFRAF